MQKQEISASSVNQKQGEKHWEYQQMTVENGRKRDGGKIVITLLRDTDESGKYKQKERAN